MALRQLSFTIETNAFVLRDFSYSTLHVGVRSAQSFGFISALPQSPSKP